MPDRPRHHRMRGMLWAVPLFALSCVFLGNGAERVTVIVVTATPTAPSASGGGNTPSVNPGSTPSATYTVVHNLIPPGAQGTTRFITDPETRPFALQQTAPPGSDIFPGNRYERPFASQTMAYLADVDLTRVEMKIDLPWVYITFTYVYPRAEGIGQTVYGAEFDTDRDGRGEYLVWGVSPPGGNWTTEGVEVWSDSNSDVGGLSPQVSDPPAAGADGYDRKIFADGQGEDPDLAWIRQIGSGEKVQLAFKYSAIGGAAQFLWNALADAGVRRSDWFDYNDHFTAAEAGSPLAEEAGLYPVKALAAVDNTCRDAYGFTPTGTEPGLCLYDGTVTGTLFKDGSCANPSAAGNGVIDAGEEGSSVGRFLLGKGACPVTGFRDTTPDSLGHYTFTGVPVGTYCVTHQYENWIEYTTPNPVTVNLTTGEREVVNFGVHVELMCEP